MPHLNSRFSSLRIRPKILIGISIPLCMLVIAGSVTVWSLMTIMHNDKWTTHTYSVLESGSEIVAAAVDMETGMRGFLLAGKDEFLEPYAAGKKTFAEKIESLKKTVSDNPPQVARLKNVEKTISDWQTLIVEPMIEMRRNVGSTTTMVQIAGVTAEARGKQYFDAFRGLMKEFDSIERKLLVIRGDAKRRAETLAFILIGACTIIGLLAGSGLGLAIAKGITDPLNRMMEAMGVLAKGETGIEIPNIERTDEVGEMARSVQVFKENLIENERLQEEQRLADTKQKEADRKAAEQERLRAAEEAKQAEAATQRTELISSITAEFEKSASEALSVFSAASGQMRTAAEGMSSTAEQTSQRSVTVASASEEASTNTQTVATATEELSSSIEEIGRQAAESARVARSAVTETDDANVKVKGLEEAAGKIGEVINLINDIASQTNLLALNATIEAARAGEAGKGFAVVATEVKSLADQTARATEEISGQIGQIQGATMEAVNAIASIGKTIRSVDDISSSIAAAVEEQDAATREIAANIQQVASATTEVNSNISSVSSAADETGTAAREVLKTGEELNQQATALQSAIDDFMAKVKAA